MMHLKESGSHVDHLDQGREGGRKNRGSRGRHGRKNRFSGETVDWNGSEVRTEGRSSLKQREGGFGQAEDSGFRSGGFAGRGSRCGTDGGRGSQGSGGRSSNDGTDHGGVKNLIISSSPRSSEEYEDYPGWKARELHHFLESLHMYRNRNTKWNSIAGHTAKECKDIWEKLQNDLEPVTMKTAIYRAKILLLHYITPRDLRMLNNVARWPPSIMKTYVNMNYKKGESNQELKQKYRAKSITEQAPWKHAVQKRKQQCFLAYFDYYKENPEEINKICHLRM